MHEHFAFIAMSTRFESDRSVVSSDPPTVGVGCALTLRRVRLLYGVGRQADVFLLVPARNPAEVFLWIW